MKIRLTIFSYSFSDVLLSVAVLVIHSLSQYADGIWCVQCGYTLGPCCPTLPPATECEAKYTSCGMGMIEYKNGKEEELRKCVARAGGSGGNPYGSNVSSSWVDFCQTDGCNAGPVDPRPHNKALKCVQCGWKYPVSCGTQHPPATNCEPTSPMSCLRGTFTYKNGTVEEARTCYTASGYPHATDDVNGEILEGNLCGTDRCNSDGYEPPVVCKFPETSTKPPLPTPSTDPNSDRRNGGPASSSSTATNPLLLWTFAIGASLVSSSSSIHF